MGRIKCEEEWVAEKGEDDYWKREETVNAKDREGQSRENKRECK